MSTITASQEQKVVDEVPKQLYIGGEWRDGAKGTLSVEDPSTGEALCEVADASVDDAKAALDAAVDAGPEWAATAPRERGEILRRAFDMITERKDELALLMTLEMGKPVAESQGEIAYAAEFFRWFSEEAVRIDGRYAVAANGSGRHADDEAAGRPVPADHPVELPAGDGHPQDRPGDRRRLHHGGQARAADAAVDAGAGQDPRARPACPPACSTSVTTSDVGRDDEPAASPTRGCASCPSPARPRWAGCSWPQSSDTLLRLSMELGGNAPFLVFEDADLDAAVDGAMLAKMRNMGEACTSANRFHVAGVGRRRVRTASWPSGWAR